MKILIQLFLIFFILHLASCNSCNKKNYGLPTKDNVKLGKKLEIDGLYYMSNEMFDKTGDGFRTGAKIGSKGLINIPKPKKSTLRFERGVGYIVSDVIIAPGSVIFEQLKKVDDYTYKGIFNTGAGDKFFQYEVTIYKDDKGLVSRTTIPKDVGWNKKPLITDFYFSKAE